MIRTFWFVSGAAAGASGTVYVKRLAKSAAERMKPANLANSARQRAAETTDRLRSQAFGGVRRRVSSIRRRDETRRAERDGRLLRLAEYLDDDDEVVVDGQSVEPGKVLVLRRRDRN